MVDTNSDPTDIEFPIPANDDASKSISLLVDILCKAIEEGLNERKLEKDKEPAQKDKKVMRKELETKDLPDSVIEALVEEDEETESEEESASEETGEEESLPETEENDEQ
jgi:small subunit ribosomal protein S2